MGRVDLFHSRRINYEACEFWVRDERDATGSPQQWVTYNQPSGTFRARPLTPKGSRMNVINGVWALDSNRVTIETDDEVHDLNRGCVVRFCGELWIVEDVQRQHHWKEMEFCKNPDYKYIVALVRG